MKHKKMKISISSLLSSKNAYIHFAMKIRSQGANELSISQ